MGRPREKVLQAEAALDSGGPLWTTGLPFFRVSPRPPRTLLSYRGPCMGENAKHEQACLKQSDLAQVHSAKSTASKESHQ